MLNSVCFNIRSSDCRIRNLTQYSLTTYIDRELGLQASMIDDRWTAVYWGYKEVFSLWPSTAISCPQSNVCEPGGTVLKCSIEGMLRTAVDCCNMPITDVTHDDHNLHVRNAHYGCSENAT